MWPAAAALVPPDALEDLVLENLDPAPIAAVARRLGVSSLAVPGFDPATVGDHVGWAASMRVGRCIDGYRPPWGAYPLSTCLAMVSLCTSDGPSAIPMATKTR